MRAYSATSEKAGPKKSRTACVGSSGTKGSPTWRPLPVPLGFSPTLGFLGEDDDASVGFDALGLGGQALVSDDVVAHLALEGVHGVELDGLAGGAHAGDRLAGDVLEFFLAFGAEAGDVEHEARALAGLGLNGQAGQLLEGVQDLAVLADEAV